MWDLASDSQEPQSWDDPQEHKAHVAAVAYSPKGDFMASCSVDRTVKLWDTLSRKVVHTFSDFDGAVSCVNFSPDSTKLAAGSWDRSVKVFGLNDGYKLLHTFSHTAAIASIAFSPDGRRVAAACFDNRWYLYTLDLEEAKAMAKKKLTRQLTESECRRYGVPYPTEPAGSQESPGR